jgi:predicted DNA-binding transcriptional regulator YafY
MRNLLSPVEDKPPALSNDKTLSTSALRVLMVLKWLTENQVMSLQNLRNNLIEYAYLNRTCSDETILKYINTLKVLGCKIHREQKDPLTDSSVCYRLESNPFPLVLSHADVLIAQRLLTILGQHTDQGLVSAYQQFLKGLSWSLSNEQAVFSEGASCDHFFEIPDSQHSRKQAGEFQQYCQQSFNLELQYQDENNSQILTCQVEPYDLIERKHQWYLLALDILSNRQKILPLAQILSVNQLPSKNKRKIVPVHVLFSLYGRLASSYRLYPGEKILFKGRQELHIKSSVLETDSIMQRLLKYGVNCQILAPQSLRQLVKKRIEQKMLFLGTRQES